MQEVGILNPAMDLPTVWHALCVALSDESSGDALDEGLLARTPIFCVYGGAKDRSALDDRTK